MKILLLAALLLSPAPAAAFWRSVSVEPQKRLYAEGKYAQVISALGPETLQKMRGRNLRQAYEILGQSHEHLGQSGRALGVYQVGVKLFPRGINLLTSMGHVLKRLGLPEQAEPFFKRVLAIHPNNASSNLGLAEIEASLGFFERSAGHYEKALEEYKDAPRLWRDYAETLLRQRELQTAALAAERSLALSRDADGLAVLAFIRREAGLLEQALPLIEEAVSKEPARAELRRAKALWLLEAGRHQEAQTLAETLLKTDPQDAAALFTRARAHLKADRYNAALADLRAASLRHREDPFAARLAEALIERLEGRRR